MQSQNLLPISNPNSSNMIPTSSSATADTMLILVQENDDSKIEKKPLLSRTFSYTSSSSSSSNLLKQQQRRRRIASENSLCSVAVESCSQDMERAASDTFVVTKLSFTLLRYLGVGYRWIVRFLALGCYAMLLIPGFIQVGYYYFHSTQVRRGIVYGDQPRNRLDLYLPKNMNGPKPVVAFVTGGAWIIGYKAWGSLLGQQLSERDIIVACIDYRNFPQGTISDMVKDASQGISFVCNKIAEYGGDPNRIYLMGQSAGAHIASCALLEQAIKEASEDQRDSWSVSQIKAYFGLSGGYNFLNLVDHFHSRGLYRSIFLSIMEGEQGLRRYSPEVMAQDPNVQNAVSLLPPIVLFHGTADYSIPCNSSKSFADTLKALGVNAECILYEGKTHTDLFLQDPMRGGIDDMLNDLITMIHGDNSETIRANSTPRKRLVPEFMLKLARSVSPF
ncbi:putative isoprenylcysteine alpha-carbonyl methylesterase ICMEL1 isoform X1 [Nicotiana tabacum]|uniref:protein-S-isoprenylcysteine alpha-carbonyl methylesterase n=2 Tax=Nicotiana TaxID=4085 RepID=A0A1S3YWR9_TOBAC|nr:PREDICTED: probable isoprenylcysteine alpha-carbonyl methylesterase ICMEL1 isoform X1 [Nicotiana sylvestris]XP_009769055.1 PREDICTED: probable isoprenylcysteine alpha-carbonyl methylesterase ICMEL1 isoform X2 [Nicotiana sylvestris]XP_016456766.1 PREDICTED: probable isoprenylcysteine alpha-carbonyl methylesterase ICMEL1 isoform X1 [Nicotiana tabacum]